MLTGKKPLTFRLVEYSQLTGPANPPSPVFEKNCSKILFHNSFHTALRKLHKKHSILVSFLVNIFTDTKDNTTPYIHNIPQYTHKTEFHQTLFSSFGHERRKQTDGQSALCVHRHRDNL
jgi:hypothetical protein